jgi:hypothetical protein
MKFVLITSFLLCFSFSGNAQETVTEVSNSGTSLVLLDSTRIEAVQQKAVQKFPEQGYFWLQRNIQQPAVINKNKIVERTQPEQWVLYLFFGVVLYYTMIRNGFAKSLQVIFQAYWNDRAITQFTRDDNFFKMRNAVMYFLLFCVVFSFLIFQMAAYFELAIEHQTFQNYLLLVVSVGAFYLLKYFGLKLSGLVFNAQRLVSGYLSIISVSNVVWVVLMIPMLILMHFLRDGLQVFLVYIVLASFVFNTFYKYLRSGTFILNNFQFPKFYLFLYLCTLEIMPLLLIYKMFLA